MHERRNARWPVPVARRNLQSTSFGFGDHKIGTWTDDGGAPAGAGSVAWRVDKPLHHRAVDDRASSTTEERVGDRPSVRSQEVSVNDATFTLTRFEPRFSAVLQICLLAEGCDCLAEGRARFTF